MVVGGQCSRWEALKQHDVNVGLNVQAARHKFKVGGWWSVWTSRWLVVEAAGVRGLNVQAATGKMADGWFIGSLMSVGACMFRLQYARW